jgi:hypothetical protein
MSPTEIAEVEQVVGVRLPAPYVEALQSERFAVEQDEHPEFITDPKWLTSENKHFKMDPGNLAEIRGPGMFGALKFYLLYGSGKRLLESRRKWHTKWAKGQRFVVGSDLGEEQYFIVLSEPDPAVYCYELETQRSRKVAPSVAEWVAEARRRQQEGESET